MLEFNSSNLDLGGVFIYPYYPIGTFKEVIHGGQDPLQRTHHRVRQDQA